MSLPRNCRMAKAARPRIADLLRDCGSGRELWERGYAGDVRHAARLDAFDAVPALSGRALGRETYGV